MFAALIDTSRGSFLARYTEHGLAWLVFPGRASRKPSGDCPLAAASPAVRCWHRQTSHAVTQMLRGQPPRSVPPLDLNTATPFQKKVWAALRKIKWGQTCTYADLARAVRQPGATRAVGNACGANPIPLLIPCHRVVAQGGKLGGFSAGLPWKRFLLDQESASPRAKAS